MLRCSRGLRDVGRTAQSLDTAAIGVVGYLYSQFADPGTKEPQCALVRFYKTSIFRDLSPDLQAFAQRKMGGVKLKGDTRVLTLVASVGAESAWCDPARSVDHRAIPLPSVEIVEQAPMIAGLIKSLGLEISDVVAPSPSLLKDAQGKTYNVFHVPKAAGSELIPAQTEFVIPYGIEAVIGFGGILPSAELFAIVLFSRVPVGAEQASRFKNVALDVKAILHRFSMADVSL